MEELNVKAVHYADPAGGHASVVFDTRSPMSSGWSGSRARSAARSTAAQAGGAARRGSDHAAWWTRTAMCDGRWTRTASGCRRKRSRWRSRTAVARCSRNGKASWEAHVAGWEYSGSGPPARVATAHLRGDARHRGRCSARRSHHQVARRIASRPRATDLARLVRLHRPCREQRRGLQRAAPAALAVSRGRRSSSASTSCSPATSTAPRGTGRC